MPGDDWRALLASQPFIPYERASFGGRAVDVFLRKHRVAVRECVELDEIDAMAAMVRAGLGVVLLPCTALLNERGLRLLPLGADAFTHKISIIGRLPMMADSWAGVLAQCLEHAAG